MVDEIAGEERGIRIPITTILVCIVTSSEYRVKKNRVKKNQEECYNDDKIGLQDAEEEEEEKVGLLLVPMVLALALALALAMAMSII